MIRLVFAAFLFFSATSSAQQNAASESRQLFVGPYGYQLKDIGLGDYIGQDDVVYVRNTLEEEWAIISFSINDINEKFIRSVFQPSGSSSSWVEPGVELILTEDELVVRIDPGVAFVVRNKASKLTGPVFKEADSHGLVVSYCGKVYKTRIDYDGLSYLGESAAIHFPRDDYYQLGTQKTLQDGTIVGEGAAFRDVDLARVYPPRLLSSNGLRAYIDGHLCPNRL